MIPIDDFVFTFLVIFSVARIQSYWKIADGLDIHYIWRKEDEFLFWVLAEFRCR